MASRRKNVLSLFLLAIALLINLHFRIGYRVLICLAVSASTLIHTHFFYDSVSFEYYGTAAIANLCAILLIHLLDRSPLATSIQIITLIGLTVNFIGWAMYEAGYSPEFYVSAMVALFVLEFLRLIIRTDSDRIHDACKDDRLLFGFFTNDSVGNTTNRSGSK